MYPAIAIRMGDKQALEPAARVMGVSISPEKRKKSITCTPQQFPPKGKGQWQVRTTGKRAERLIQRLDPLLTPTSNKNGKTHSENAYNPTPNLLLAIAA